MKIRITLPWNKFDEMKKILLALFIGLSLLAPSKLKAQTFTPLADTVGAFVAGSSVVYDNIKNLTTTDLAISWHVIASDFPADWYNTSAVFGACDNHLCYGVSNGVWPAGATFHTTYHANAARDSVEPFDLTLNYASVSYGTHYMTIQLTDGSTTKNMTFIIHNIAPSATPVVANTESNIVLYPNPASNEINIVYDANAGIKNIAVYNIIGKLQTVYKVSGNSANLNLENTPAGIYFARLMNSTGEVVATRKFTKQ